jgi:hypothetical protein
VITVPVDRRWRRELAINSLTLVRQSIDCHSHKSFSKSIDYSGNNSACVEFSRFGVGCGMFKRLFLAGTIAFPLYLMIAIGQSPSLSDSMARSPDRLELINQKVDQQVKNVQQQFDRVRSKFSAD